MSQHRFRWQVWVCRHPDDWCGLEEQEFPAVFFLPVPPAVGMGLMANNNVPWTARVVQVAVDLGSDFEETTFFVGVVPAESFMAPETLLKTLQKIEKRREREGVA